MWNQSQIFSNATEVSGNTSRAYVVLKTTNSSIEMALAISFVSIEQAKYNLKSQWSSTRFFDDYVKAARRIWAETLSQVNVTTESNESLVTFYTALYHAFMAPTQFSDSSGVYLDMENKVKRLPPGMHHYTDMSIWDIHRSQIPLLNMLRPDISSQVAQSLVRMYRDGGDLPRWPIANVYSGCMIGTHANLILLDLLSKVGSDTFDIDDAYEGMVAQATESKRPHVERSCLDEYVTLGYVPNECSSESVSLTLAYAFDDWAIATVASHLNRTNDAALFFNRSRSYRNVWNHDKKLMCPRDRHGKFHCPLDPSLNSWMIKNDGYTEGNAEQWLWFVPHDIPGLINLFGSNESFSETLEKFFSRSEDYTSNLLPNPFYWAGNEPDILAPYLFNYAGRADLTQKYTRWLADHRYTTAPSGLPGNDDYGTLSSWYIWTTLGFYPYSGTQYYAIGSPSVQSAVITLPNGILTIETHNNSKENVYVMKVVVNNRTVDLQRNPFFHHKRDIENGGHIQFWMSNNPT